MSENKQKTAYPLRMPPELRGKLEASAAESKRSLNAEIIARLEECLTTPSTPYSVHTERDASIQVLTEMYQDALTRIAALKAYGNLSAMDQVELQHEEETAKYLRHAAARATAASLTRQPDPLKKP